MDQADESVVIANAVGRIVYANLAAERQIGRPRSELIGRHFLVALAAGEDAAQFEGMSRTVGAGETWSGRHVLTTASGSRVAADIVISPVRDAAGRVVNVVAIARDVSRESALEGDLEREVRLHAGIVSTLSRLGSSDSVEEQAQCLADALMDLEGVQIARVLALGPGDVWSRLAGRGGDGMTVLSAQRSNALVRAIRRRSRNGPWVDTVQRWAAVSRIPTSVEAVDISVIACAPIRDRDVLVGLLVAATTDRTQAVAFEGHLPAIAELADVASAMLGASLAARQRAADVRSVLERTIEEAAFWPAYQPIRHLPDGRILGYEALTRFEDGRPPDERFAEAAAVGLGLELELATLRATLEGARALPHGAFLSVNVSPALVVERRRLEALLGHSETERPLVLEITEREPIGDYPALRDAIAAITVPVSWAIDDAGAGYASLRHILELRPQYVKLDRLLIADIGLDPARQALVAGLVHFSEAIGTTLIAEGIETDAERVALEHIGLTAGQGYLLGRPERIQ